MGDMRFMQISDLHLGKKLRERSLDEDQRYILGQIADIAERERVDGLIIAGDVFDDGSSMGVEAVRTLDWFLTDLSQRGIETYLISGNHDNMDRLGYGREFFGTKGIHIASVFEDEMERYSKTKDGVTVDLYMLPFIKPVHARRMYGDESITTYEQAVKAAIDHADIVPGDRFRILVTHQFVTNAGVKPIQSDSEKVYVGNTENVDASVFDRFDYVALGHIHRCQDVGSERVHYCGAPLKYSVDEYDQRKSVTIMDIDRKGFTRRLIELKPLREVRMVTGPLEGIVEAAKQDPDRDDYIYARLTDSPENAMDRLREVFPNIMGMETPRVGQEIIDVPMDIEGGIDPVSAFGDFYMKCTGERPTEDQIDIVVDMLSKGVDE